MKIKNTKKKFAVFFALLIAIIVIFIIANVYKNNKDTIQTSEGVSKNESYETEKDKISNESKNENENEVETKNETENENGELEQPEEQENENNDEKPEGNNENNKPTAATTNQTKPTNPKVDNKSEYYIKVNVQCNVVNVYKKDENGNYTIPYKAMVCSTGTATPLSGVYKTSDKYTWRLLVGNVYGQYCTRIVGSILFHSVPYFTQNKGDLEYLEYDKLGTSASAGCVRLMVEDSLWIYNNCQKGTQVEFYSDADPGPFGKPTAPKIANEDESVRHWDPTDPDERNPWRTYNKQEQENEQEVEQQIVQDDIQIQEDVQVQQNESSNPIKEALQKSEEITENEENINNQSRL